MVAPLLGEVPSRTDGDTKLVSVSSANISAETLGSRSDSWFFSRFVELEDAEVGKGRLSVSKRAAVACKGEVFSRMCPRGLWLWTAGLRSGWHMAGGFLAGLLEARLTAGRSVCGAQVFLFWRLLNHALRRLSPRLPVRGNGCDRSVLSRCSRCSIHLSKRLD